MTTSTRVNELDLLRFLSAMAVVLFHYAFQGPVIKGYAAVPHEGFSAMAQYGSYGVELFFMISGFVILMTAGSGSLRQFVISRTVRLYPAFWVCCTLTFVAILWMGAPLLTATVPQYLANLTMLNEFFSVKSIDGVYWTLVVELRFYLLIALVLAFGKIHRIEPLLALWLALSIAMEIKGIGAVRRIFITDHSGFFIAGSACYLVWARGLSAPRIGLIAVSWVLVVYQAMEALATRGTSVHFKLDPWAVALIVSMFFVVMLLVSLRKTGPLRERRWVLAGALTYPLYLVHQNIGYMLIGKLYPAVDPHAAIAITMASMLLLAYAVHVIFEKRMARRMNAALQRLTGSTSAARVTS